jgi:tRNA (guanine37-N1)-methyltransferase
MQFDIITIFPQIFDSYFSESILKRAQNENLIKINIHNLRDYADDKRRTVDDTPYGGGAGMVMKAEPIFKCVNAIEKNQELGIRNKEKTRIILLSAKGKRYAQSDARRLSQYENLIFICGRYEGVDERVVENIADEEISIGDYVLTGGEIPAMVVVDSISRLLPGVLGNEQSAEIESHSQEGYLEFPQYTKPENFNDWKVPEVLLSGNHAEIEKWRKEKSHSKADPPLVKK